MLISIIIPCYNEEKNINRTFDGLIELMKNESYDYEIIAVDDGSKDKTWEVISSYAEKYPQIKGINLMSNFGQSCAYTAGFDEAKGDYIITVSADLEIPLDNIMKILVYLDQGYDFVNTNRVGRWGGKNTSRASQSGLANKIITKISGVNMKDRGSGMKGFRRIVIEKLNLYGDMHRFIPDYISLYGAKMIEFEVDFKDRDFGVSAYKGNKRTVKVLLDLITLAFMLKFSKKPFSMMPGRLFGFTGAVIAGLGGIGLFYLFILKILGQSIGGRPLLILSVLLVIVGVQSVMMGLIGELMMRTYFESSGRKTYTIRKKI
ncbi:MAG TPA: glycosyltransferase family 2 protein [bacterium]|nr:glycosyltransferase family 2 protein [bacterium]